MMNADSSSSSYNNIEGERLIPSLNKSHYSCLKQTRTRWLLLGLMTLTILVVLVPVLVVILPSSSSSSSPIGVAGANQTIAGITTYVTGTATTALVIATDIFGMGDDVTLIADTYAAAGYTVFMPDLFDGNINNRNITRSIIIASTVTQTVIKMNKYRSIQSQGYCYGGKVVAALNEQALVASSVSAHGSGLNYSLDATTMVAPIFFVQPEVDPGFNNQAAQFDAILNSRHIPHVFKIYPNTTHGFAVASNRAPISEQMKQEALQDSIAFFNSHK